MTPHQTKLRGETVWTADLRSQKLGRVFGATRDEVMQKVRERMKGTHEVAFTDEDKVAKMELVPGKTLLQAVRYFNARQPAKVRRTINEVGKEWVAHMEANNYSKAYRNRCRGVLKQFKLYVGNDGESHGIDEITSDQIANFIRASSPEIETQRTFRGRLGHLYKFAMERGNVTENPVLGIKIKAPRQRRDPPRIFTVDECRRLLDTARDKYPNMIPFLALALFCGVRPYQDSEMGRITAADIHLDSGVLEIPEGTSKCGPGRTVRLVHTIAQREIQKDGTTVDRSIHFEPARAWLRIAPSLEIVTHPYWRKKLCADAKVEWSPDVTRHTFASYHFYGFKNGTDTAELMGHRRSLDMLRKHYLQRVSEEACAEFWKLLPPPALSIVKEKVA